MKPLVIYHGSECTDGFGAAFAAWLKFGDAAEYLPMDYMKADGKSTADLLHEFSTEKLPGVCISEREIFILDFSLPRCVMDWVFSVAKRVVWLDHHKTAFEMWVCPEERPCTYWREHVEGTPCHPSSWYITLDNNKSGALLAWEYFHPGTEVPRLIQHIDDYDRWQFKLDGTKEVHAALASYAPWSFEQWWSFLAWEDFRQEGAVILRAHNQNVQAALKQTRPCAIRWFDGETDGHPAVNVFTGLACNAPSFLASDLGHELANKSGTFGLVWSLAGDGQVHCSLRSNGEYDVSAIAKVFGGGGHRNAAGFSTDINTLMGWLK